MSSFTSRLRAVLANQVLRRVRGRPSPAVFWGLPEPPAVLDPPTLQAYREGPTRSPRYLMDYRAKLTYRETNAQGVLVLHYPEPVGTQVNPEAAFQHALGQHDAALLDDDRRAGESFLQVAEVFRTDQTHAGLWPYQFSWHQSTAPWYSALAQSRGASVMLRAWKLTGRPHFRDAAVAALTGLDERVDQGGFRATHPMAGVTYFEEYPSEPTAVLNGFMATLFGVYELAEWAGDSESLRRFEEGVESLGALLPYYEHRRWTLYDLDPRSSGPNINSPRYHRLVTDYLSVLSGLTGSTALIEARDRWAAWDMPIPRLRAALLKAHRKLTYR